MLNNMQFWSRTLSHYFRIYESLNVYFNKFDTIKLSYIWTLNGILNDCVVSQIYIFFNLKLKINNINIPKYALCLHGWLFEVVAPILPIDLACFSHTVPQHSDWS